MILIWKEEILKSSLIELNNYPNPFNPTTTIRYLVPNVVTSRDFSLQRNISLQVYDVLGKLVNTLVDELKPAGNYNVEFDGSNLSSGVYYYQLRAGEFIESRKMLLLK